MPAAPGVGRNRRPSLSNVGANASIHTLKRNESGRFRCWVTFANRGADLRKRSAVPIRTDGRFASW